LNFAPAVAPASPPPAAAAAPQRLDPRRGELIAAIIGSVLRGDLEFREYYRTASPVADNGLADYLFAVNDEPHSPANIFPRLRWGGQFIYISEDRRQVAETARRFAARGFSVVKGPACVRTGLRLLGIPLWTRKVHYVIARKVCLVRPREVSHRFTYHVTLSRRAEDDQYVVVKEVPSLDAVVLRLRRRYPALTRDVVENRARRFVEDIFPLFLTREAKMLQYLQRELPEAYSHRVPRLIDAEEDIRGRVQRIRMRWMRNGGSGLSQLQFAKQAADLLAVLHDVAGVMHLDLRLDNMVITHNGVGFVDFGSAVRVDEDLAGNATLAGLFDELMKTSQIQRMMQRMRASGLLTSDAIRRGMGRVDKAVDWFYLAVQLNHPHENPDFRGLVHFVPESREARAMQQLTAEILRPADPNRPTFRSAMDILRGVEYLEEVLVGRSVPRMTS